MGTFPYAVSAVREIKIDLLCLALSVKFQTFTNLFRGSFSLLYYQPVSLTFCVHSVECITRCIVLKLVCTTYLKTFYVKLLLCFWNLQEHFRLFSTKDTYWHVDNILITWEVWLATWPPTLITIFKTVFIAHMKKNFIIWISDLNNCKR